MGGSFLRRDGDHCAGGEFIERLLVPGANLEANDQSRMGSLLSSLLPTLALRKVDAPRDRRASCHRV